MQKTNNSNSIEKSNQTYKVIVIEDNEALNRLIVKNLNKEGFETRAAFNAQQGLEQIKGSEREIILLDYKLPDMDARELIQHMNEQGLESQFIIMTAHGGEKIAVEFMRMGAIDYVVKEKDFTDLLIPKVKRACDEIENKKQLTKARNKLRKSEAKYRSLVEEMDDLVCRFDTDGKPIFVNDSYQQYFALDNSQELDGFMPLIPEQDQDKAEKYFRKLSKNQSASSIEHRVIARNNELRWVHWRTRPIIDEDNELIAFQGIGRDITKRKKAEKALKESEEKYRRLIEASPGITYIYGTDSGAIFWSSRVEDILGFSSEELKNDPLLWTKSIHPDDRDMVKKTISDCHKGEKFDIEYRIEDMDGKWHWIHDRCVSVQKRNGEKIIEGLATDITHRKKAEEALRESENKFRSLVEQAAEMLFLHDTDGNIIDINNTAVDKTDYTRKELLNMNVLDIDSDIDEKDAKQKYWDRLAPHDKPITFETHHKTKNGTIYPVEVTISKVELSNGKYILALGRDITERKEAEEEKEKLQKQLLQSQKLESIGTLASGIAHDFNNILTVIIGLSQMTLNNTEKSSPNHNNLKNILDAAQRAADLTKQILLFSRKQKMIFRPASLNQIIEKLEKMLDRLIGENITMKNNLADDLWLINADEGQIEQVITNIAVNARDAMSEGGKLIISTHNVKINKEKAKTIPNIEPGKYVRLDIEDTGKGMDEKTRAKIFDPFFTTKGRARGTGMGLSVVHGIIKKHNGIINVYSEPGKGTIFRIYLPIIKEQNLDDSEQEEENIDQYTGENQTVLIVEDETPVLSYLESILNKYGYNYYSAQSGEEALEIFDKHRPEIDLLISDVIMGGMSGTNLADRIKEKDGDISIILSSGYSNREVEHSDIADKGYQFIQKPYNVNELLKMIYTTLESK